MEEQQQNEGNEEGGGGRAREAEGGEVNACNVRQNRGPPAPHWHVQRLPIARENLQMVAGAFVGEQRNVLNPNARIVSLEYHMQDGPERGTLLVMRIMSIKPAAKDEKTQIQQRYNNNRGQSKSVGFQRKITMMCPLSSPGANMCMVFQGNGNNPRMFDCDPSLRDNGSLSTF